MVHDLNMFQVVFNHKQYGKCYVICITTMQNVNKQLGNGFTATERGTN